MTPPAPAAVPPAASSASGGQARLYTLDDLELAYARGLAAGRAEALEQAQREVRPLANGWRAGGEPTHSFVVTSRVIQELDHAAALIRALAAAPAGDA